MNCASVFGAASCGPAPAQVSGAGFDGLKLTAHTNPLTTMEAPLYEIGARGERILLQQMSEDVNDETPLETLLPACLQVRS